MKKFSLKKISPVVVVGILLTILCLAILVLKPPFIHTLSNFAYDEFLKQTASNPKSDSVCVVDLDEASLAEYGQWPWSRYLVAQLTQKIMDAGATVIAFDIVFAEKDRTSPALIMEKLNKHFDVNARLEGVPDELKDYDTVFANTLSQGKTILGCFMLPVPYFPDKVNKSIDPYYKSRVLTRQLPGIPLNTFLIQTESMTISIPELNKESATAFFNAVADPDNIVRSNPLIMAFGDRIYPSLALEAVIQHTGRSNCQVKYADQGIEEIQVKDIKIPTDRSGRLVVNYRKVRESTRGGFYSSFPSYPAADVLKGIVGRNAFEGKIVFIGTSAIGLKDMKATPLCPDFSGVEVHATMVDNILSQDMLYLPDYMPGVHALVVVIVGIFLTILISKGKSWLSGLISLLLILAAIKTSLILIGKHNLVFVPAWIIISIVIQYPILTTIKFWQEEMQKRKVRNMFETMVSETVLHYLENNPESFSLTGRRVEATVFFADVAGFTTISENLEADRLTELLNRYLSPMTDIIMARNGYVDKYEGDLIMAEWGVPYATDDHASQACLAAIEQQEKLDEIRPALHKEFGHKLFVRMGINSGQVVAGNMGSDKKFQYTVMGDAVNQASRFEPVNKDYGTSIIIGETTYKAAKDVIEARLIDKLVVKGKTLPINIYEVLARKNDLKFAKAEVIKLYEEALQLHWERKWDESIKCFTNILELDPNDTPSAIMLKRVEEYKINPPHESWRGEYVRASKD